MTLSENITKATRSMTAPIEKALAGDEHMAEINDAEMDRIGTRAHVGTTFATPERKP